MHYKNDEGNLIKRQLLVANAEFELIPEKAELIISESSEGACLRPEFDILEEKVSKKIEDQLKERLEKNSSLTVGNIGDILKFILNSTFSAGEYSESLALTNVKQKPTLTFSPVVILRDRSVGGIIGALRDIDEQLDNQVKTSNIFKQLTGELHTNDAQISDSANKAFEKEVFFPKPCNEEQRSIIDKINSSNGVIVQGPPGTGKSHTIANLICHLLATGNRVLVTAKTTTALSVLRTLLPEKMRSLGVLMLGYGNLEKNLLEESIYEILNKADSFNEEKSKKRIAELCKKLDFLKRNQAEMERQLIDITGAEMHLQTVAGGQYSGTAAEIAKKVSDEREKYCWFKDTILPNEKFSLSQEELYQVLAGMREFSELKGELSLCFEEIMPTKTFCEFVKDSNEKALLFDLGDLQHGDLYLELSEFSEEELNFSLEKISFLLMVRRNIFSAIESLNKSFIDSLPEPFLKRPPLRELLLSRQVDLVALEERVAELIAKKSNILDVEQSIRSATEQILSLPENWIKTILNEVISLNKSDKVTQAIDKTLTEAEKFFEISDSYKINIPDDVSLKQMVNEVERLLDYTTNGKSLNKFNIFMPKEIRNAWQTVNKVRNNKKARLSSIELEKIKSTLLFETEICNAKQLLVPYFQINTNSSPREQLEQIKRGNAILKKIFEIKKQSSELQILNSSFVNELRKFVKSYYSSVGGISPAQLADIEKICNFLLLKKRKSKACNALSLLEEQLRRITINPNAHTVMCNLLEAVRKNDTGMYESERIKLDKLLRKRTEFLSLKKAIERMNVVIPLTMKSMEETYKNPNWENRVAKIKQAWDHSQAVNWISNYVNTDKFSKIWVEMDKISKEIKKTVEEITLEKSWYFCISNLTSEQKKHIALWQQAVRKIGKGTGKYANCYIKSAQAHFRKCRDAVPAWIMPLHNVWNSVSISPEAFDMVIVDEASQCGIEAVPLFYIAKKIIIVGDDKQISPENVGLDRSVAHKWADEYLRNIDQDLFDIDNSLFDIGRAIFNSNKVVLREHFRCMPEIIEFSNRLCYQHTPLIPLKQYGKNRLSPLEDIFLQDGYKDGEGANSVNMPEVKVIIEKITQMCSDEKYRDRSIGVIVLQGKRQANEIEIGLSRSLGEKKIKEHQIKCGTPEQFQGDERDVVLLSMVVANNMPFSALTKQSYERKFNVAMSRAREQVILVRSVKKEDLSSFCLRRRLIAFFESKDDYSIIPGVSLNELKKLAGAIDRKERDPPYGFDSWFEVDVAIEIMLKGYRVIPQYKVAGKRIDIVVEGGKSRLAVECDGDHYHGTAEQQEHDIHRQRQLERCGWGFFRIRSSAFYYDKQKSMDDLWRMLKERSIDPIAVG